VDRWRWQSNRLVTSLQLDPPEFVRYAPIPHPSTAKYRSFWVAGGTSWWIYDDSSYVQIFDSVHNKWQAKELPPEMKGFATLFAINSGVVAIMLKKDVTRFLLLNIDTWTTCPLPWRPLPRLTIYCPCKVLYCQPAHSTYAPRYQQDASTVIEVLLV
jgi:hypothetical protein